MTRGAILGGAACALVVLTWVCVARHVPPTIAGTPTMSAWFHARLEQGTLTLRGALPDHAIRNAVVEQAHRRYDRDRVRIVDDLSIDPLVASADWIKDLPRVLPALGSMAGRGSIIVDGRSIVVSGRASTEQAKQDVLHTVAPITLNGLELEDHVMAATESSKPFPFSRGLQSQLDAILQHSTIEFESNKTAFTAQGLATLHRIVHVLKAAPYATIEIGGHTDGFGAADYNVELSRRRAESVRRYLVQQGVSHHMTAVGYGSRYPISQDKSRVGLQRNRRIAFRVLGDGNL